MSRLSRRAAVAACAAQGPSRPRLKDEARPRVGLAGHGRVLPFSAPHRSSRGGRPKARPERDWPETSCSRTRTGSRRGPSTSTLPHRGVALDRADGSFAAWRGVHVRLDRKPPRLDMHSVDRIVPEFQHPEVRRHDRLRVQSNARRARGDGPCSRLALRGLQLGVDVHPRAPRRRDATNKPQPLPTPEPQRPSRHGADGACVARHGAERCCAESSSARNGLLTRRSSAPDRSTDS